MELFEQDRKPFYANIFGEALIDLADFFLYEPVYLAPLGQILKGGIGNSPLFSPVTHVFQVDADNGGDLRGMIDFCQSVLDSIDEDTIVIPGHGEVSDYDGLRGYIAMLEDMHQSIGDMVKAGKTLAEVIAAKPTKAYDDVFGDSANFVDRAYASLSREQSAN